MAHGLGPGAKLPTVLQLRDTLGVSVATLNSALGELEAQKIICRKHGVGIYVSPQLGCKAIRLICDPFFFHMPGASPFWQMLVEHAKGRAAANQEALSLHFAMPSEQGALLYDSWIDEMGAGRVHGVLSVGLDESAVAWIEGQHVPVVAFAGPAPWIVGLDGHELIRIGVEALAEQGCRRIGLWSPTGPSRHDKEVLAETGAYESPFREALARCGLAFDPALVQPNEQRAGRDDAHAAGTHQAQGYQTTLEVFAADNGDKPDGIVSTDDMMTGGALGGFQKLGMRVGSDVKIATHANRGSPVLLGWEESLTVIEIDPFEIVQAMSDMLETLMDGKTPSERVVLIKPKRKR